MVCRPLGFAKSARVLAYRPSGRGDNLIDLIKLIFLLFVIVPTVLVLLEHIVLDAIYGVERRDHEE